jgi:Enoyl-CoA hydratase/carnithine racemase
VARKRDLSARTHGLANFPQQAVWGWRQLPVPVIAAIQGVAFGGGFQLALGADMRFSPRRADVDHGDQMGLVPDMAGRRSWRASCATIFCATDLYRADFLGPGSDELRARDPDLRRPRAPPSRSRARSPARAPTAIRAAKRMLNNLSVDPGPALLAESVEQMKLMGGPNQQEAVRANLEKRAPRFADAG